MQEYSENLREITRFLASAGVPADRVIFITPPPVHEPAWEKECILKGSIYSHLFLSKVMSHSRSRFPGTGVILLVSFRRFPQPAKLRGRAVRPGVRPGCCSVWHRCAGPLVTDAERRSGEQIYNCLKRKECVNSSSFLTQSSS